MRLGNTVLMEGKVIRIAKQTTMASKKGHMPLKMVSRGTSGATPLMI